MQVAERLGPSLDWWLEQPFALALWSFYQLDEGDRRRRWIRQCERLELAELVNLAFNKPERLADERQKIIALAAAPREAVPAEQLLERGLRIARFVRKGQVLVS